MRILIDIIHPAHVHFFKNAIWEWEKRGYQLLITTRDKEMTHRLLQAYNIPFKNISKYGAGVGGLIWELVKRDWKLYRLARAFNPDILLGIAGVSIAHVGRWLGKPSLVFTDTEHARLSNAICLPFATRICTPSCFREDWGGKHLRYNGFHELAYLHPNRFKPDATVLTEAGFKPKDRFFIVRFVSWGALHDVGQRGISGGMMEAFIASLSKFGRPLITSEGKLPPALEKYRITTPAEQIHSLLYFASMYVGESPTMATEAAILGIPAVLICSWACRVGNMRELTDKYQLMSCFTDTAPGIQKALELVTEPQLKEKWRAKSQLMLKEKIDVTKWLVALVESYNRSSGAGCQPGRLA